MFKVRTLVSFVVYYSGLIFIFRSSPYFIYGHKSRIICFHRVIDKSDRYYNFLRILGHLNVEEFEKRIQYLTTYYKIISISAYFNKLQKKEYSKKEIILTFDDGYRCFYKNVFPILKKFSIPATVFLTTGVIDKTEDILWYDKLIFAIAATKEKEFFYSEISEKRYKLFSWKDKHRFYVVLNAFLKSIDNEKKDFFVNNISRILKVNIAKLSLNDQMLTWKEVNEMYGSGLVTFGAHTISHPILTRIPLQMAKYEIEYSKIKIESEISQKVDFFCYPNGIKDDFNDEIKKIVKEAGYCSALTLIEDFNTTNDYFEFPRCGIIKEPFYVFVWRVSGLNDFLNSMKLKFKLVQH